MGQEIAESRFTDADFEAFRQRLARETALLGQWIGDGTLACDEPLGGFELEAWLIDGHGWPAPVNERFLDALDDPLVVPELATFNVELNTPPRRLGPGSLDTMHADLADLWQRCEGAAVPLGVRMLMVGILPTVRQQDLSLRNMSPLQRFRALNEQVFRLRHGKPIELDIRGEQSLRLEHHDVMLEAAATSFQIHLMVDPGRAVRAFNASKLLSAPMVAMAANSPYLFGADLWSETRIPLFEQAVAVGGSNYSRRVTFGVRYAESSILECFESNRDRYPVLLPTVMDEPDEALAHLRLHNGTIWRWNRPLVGFSADGRPHLRIEHRVAPSGPSATDAIANAAFYFGAMASALADEHPPGHYAGFDAARGNFYAAARHGLEAEVVWEGRRGVVADLISERLLPMAEAGLARLGVGKGERRRWLGVLERRVASRRTGAVWQRAWVAAHGPDFEGLVRRYLANQQADRPVHEWTW